MFLIRKVVVTTYFCCRLLPQTILFVMKETDVINLMSPVKLPVITVRRVMKLSAHSGVLVSSTSPTSLYLGVQADEEANTDSMFDIASERHK